MVFQSKKEEEEDDIRYEDNIIGWHDAIKSKLNEMRSARNKVSIAHLDDAIVGIMPIGEDSSFLLEQLEHKDWYLPSLEKMKEHRRCEWLSVRVLLQEVLGEEKEIAYLPSGKPYLYDHSWQISISHTKGYVAVIVDKKRNVAIDIEQIANRVEKVEDRFLSAEEKSHLSTTDRLIHLLLHWSAKESLFKILGEENVDFRTQLHIRPFAPTPLGKGIFHASESRTDSNRTFRVHYQINPEYVLTYIIS